MSSAQEYYDRLNDLMEDMASDEVDPMDLIFSIVMEYSEELLESEEDKTLKIEYDDKLLVITIEPVDGTNTARLH
ncbi:hypothetical protein ACI5DH_000111 [Cronobacter turicensis]|uniref:hypothetical protein n=1 Tax=Cronobacter turicensis TaxID=413502 RepID=UPI000CFBAD18|nr:hypothetical protein [Cronobacter turicensis]EGT5705091.1 hypothetical protein [Cronobacter sakazakii]EJG0831751.1 hypothetical protein [Cronobacter sakazakii]ELY2490251.1 hypothetical protein [Cronobacter sakazakii]MDI7404270.1 hypothetical protein [Cronobacter turicensis]HCC0172524.1 hypothetical protein [Cronobacter sakazakii]